MFNNSNSESAQNTDRTLFDQMELLVEGELDSAATQQVLAELDRRPELWKNLALDFIYQRSVKHTIAMVCEQPGDGLAGKESGAENADNIATLSAMKQPPARRRRSLLPFSTFATLAACLLLGFLGGFGLNNASLQSSFRGNVAALDQRTDNRQPQTENNPTSPEERDPSTPTGPQDTPEVARRVVGRVDWMGRFGPQLSPVFRGDAIDAQWLSTNPPQISPATKKAFESAGVKLVSKRRLINLSLDTGEKFTIPLDEYILRREQKQVF